MIVRTSSLLVVPDGGYVSALLMVFQTGGFRAETRTGHVYTEVMRVVLLAALLGSSLSSAQDAAEHPLIEPVPESVLAVAGRNDASEMMVSFREDGRRRRKTVSGPYWSLEYELSDAVSRDAIIEHFREQSAELHGVNHRDAGNRLTFSFPRSDGGETWCQVWATDGNYSLEVVDGGAPDHVSFDDAPEPSASIVFSPGLAFLDTEAKEIVGEIVDWLKAHPKVHAEVRGFSGPAEDPALSERRARLVSSEIASRGVSPDRVTLAVDEEHRRFSVEVLTLIETP